MHRATEPGRIARSLLRGSAVRHADSVAKPGRCIGLTVTHAAVGLETTEDKPSGRSECDRIESVLRDKIPVTPAHAGKHDVLLVVAVHEDGHVLCESRAHRARRVDQRCDQLTHRACWALLPRESRVAGRPARSTWSRRTSHCSRLELGDTSFEITEVRAYVRGRFVMASAPDHHPQRGHSHHGRTHTASTAGKVDRALSSFRTPQKQKSASGEAFITGRRAPSVPAAIAAA